MSHYFDAEPAVASRPGRVSLALPDFGAELQVDRGVFSAGGIDPGTLELLKADLGAPLEGNLLDLGCGYGPIACTLAHRSPHSVVWAVDINDRAIALTAANAATLGLANVKACQPGDVPIDIDFTEIWSNPPIRVGKPALHAMLQLWLPRLAPKGTSWLVVQRHLGSDSLAEWLRTEGWNVDRAASRKGYRILKVQPR
jgi:16S rRNA (guanine1207-N2)-methyltransferase